MNIFNRYTSTFLIMLILVSCSKTKAIETKMDKLVVNIEDNYLKYSDKQLEAMDKSYSSLIDEYNKNKSDFTQEQRTHINRLIGRYIAIRTKKGLNDFSNSLKDIKESVKSFIENISDSTK